MGNIVRVKGIHRFLCDVDLPLSSGGYQMVNEVYADKGSSKSPSRAWMSQMATALFLNSGEFFTTNLDGHFPVKKET